MVTVRNATLDDAPRILEIYSYYCLHTAITFEYETPSLEEFTGRMRRTMEKYPYLVIEKDGCVMGYAYAGAFVGRAAYDWSCEMTVYLDHTAEKLGLGRKIYEAMEDALKRMGILNLYACIGTPVGGEADEYLSMNSAEFHGHMGYELIGTFHKCGYKFGRWYDMIWMEKIIGTHEDEQTPIVPYPQIALNPLA
ncbi:MAG: N-acetyltransferase family protein [Eubacterium sp.]|nr:N-acetyltransferase family protein [Eubacterium sp.]